MIPIISDIVRDIRSYYKHQRKLKKRRIKLMRTIELCISKYGDHIWEGIYYSHDGKKCKNCGLTKRHWTFNDIVPSSYDKK